MHTKLVTNFRVGYFKNGNFLNTKINKEMITHFAGNVTRSPTLIRGDIILKDEDKSR